MKIITKERIILVLGVIFAFVFIFNISRVQTSASGGADRGITGDLWADIILGRRDFGEVHRGLIVPNKAQAGGVIVDNAIGKAYVWDTAHSRILGIDLDDCYGLAPTVRCSGELVIGQPSMTDWGACNRESSFQFYPQKTPASAETLCGIQEGTHTVLEDKTYVSMFIDDNSNLFVYDALNNRVLEYYAPYTTDTVADQVWGQPNFENNNCNLTSVWGQIPAQPTAQSLCFLSIGGVGAGVTLDSAGNMWVADGGNNRVLRFPNNSGTISKTADIVLGQPNFTTGGDWSYSSDVNRMAAPGAVRFGADGSLYVMDGGNARILRFDPPFVSGMNATVLLNDVDFPVGLNYFEMEPNGNYFWTGQPQDGDPNILFKKWSLGAVYQNISFTTWITAGGSIGFDADNNILLPNNNVVKYDYNNIDGTYSEGKTFFEEYFYFSDRAFNRMEGGGWGGVEVASNGQLIVSDSRILFWNDPLNATNGQAPDGYAGATGQLDVSQLYSLSAIDANDRYYVQQGDTNVRVFQAPLTNGENQIADIPLTFNVLGGGSVSVIAVTGIEVSPDGQFLWIADGQNHRVLRIKNPLTSPIVDVILGQTEVSGTNCNRGLPATDPATTTNMLCMPGGVKYDRLGNLYISDSFYEASGNLRMLMFEPNAFPDNPASVVLAPSAVKVFPLWSEAFPYSHATFTPGFDSTNRMIVGYNPYAGGRFLEYYNNPASYNPLNPNDGAYAVPSGQINDFFGWVFEITFDSGNNMYVYDGN